MDQEKTYKWIQDRIRDLHAGILTAEDRLRLHELAKTDPFVQDALEGYESNIQHDHSLLLKVIAERIQKKNSNRRPKIIPLSKGWVIPAVAASLVLILATWVVFYFIEKQGDAVFVSAEPASNPAIEHSTEVHLSPADSLYGDVASESFYAVVTDQIATGSKANSQPPASSTNPSRYDLKNTTGNNDNIVSPANVNESEQGVIAAETEKETKAESPTESAYPPPVTKPAIRASERVYKEMAADKPIAAGAGATKTQSKRDEGYYANQMSPDLMRQRVAGKVIDETTGEQVIGAMITIANTNLTEMSDLNGQFDFYIPYRTAEIVVDYTGYLITSVLIEQGSTDIVIKLNEGAMIPDARSEEKLKALNLEAKHAKYLKGDTEDFRQYLNINSIYPLASTYSPICKIVKLEFKVSKGQMLDTIKVVSSSGSKIYEQEAIRLLKSGPTWNCDDMYLPCMRAFTIFFE
ncbi:MAG: carboxypeptidase-like regulatory domain-containing protein [Saprospiraceae bacterium]